MGLSTEVIVAIVTSGCAAVSSIFVAIITYVGNNRAKQRDTQDAQYRAQQAIIEAKRDQQHAERQYLYEAMLHGINAGLSANEITLLALKHEKINGNCTAALEKVKAAQNDLEQATRKAVVHLSD
jgi:hypothetical protein